MTVPLQRTKQRDKSLSDIFNQFVKDSVERFPSLKGQLLIFDTNEKATYGRDGLDIHKAGSTPVLVDEFLKKSTTAKGAVTSANGNSTLHLHFILYDEPVPAKQRQAISRKAENDILFILDHELGHVVIKTPALEGESKQYISSIEEATSDAYALMRYYQRCGTENTYQHYMIDPWARAAELLFCKDPAHCSTFVLDEIIRRKDTIDFASLSPQQTAELARRFAVEYTPASSVLKRIFKKLKPVFEAYSESESSQSNRWLKVLAEIALDPKNDDHTFKFCGKILRGYLDGRTDKDGFYAKATGAYWDDVRKRLKEAESRLAREGILFNIPLIKSIAPLPPADRNKSKRRTLK